MAANLLRYNTGVFVATVKNVKANFPQCVNAKNTDKLIQILQQNESLPEINYDVAAMDACRANNRAKV